MSKGNTVCIFGPKGGIGKSIFCTSLAGVMANLKKKTLIIDLDLTNGTIGCLLNLKIKRTIYNYYDDYLNNRFDKIEDYVIKYNDYIDIISSPKDPRQANKIDYRCLESLIDKAKYKYDAVLIDTSSTLNEISVFALDKVDLILFMTNNDLVSLKNLKNVLNIMKDNEIKDYKIILNSASNPSKNYFSLYDIKNILGKNIDYHLSNFYCKKIDSLMMDGEIITLKYHDFKDYHIFNLICNDILGGNNE